MLPNRVSPYYANARTVLLAIAVLCTGIILAWGIRTASTSAFDDAYITFRYAQNLNRGLGLVYNSGEPVLGTTAPLFAILLGTLGWLIPDIEATGHWISVLAWVTAAWAAMGLLWRVSRPAGAAIAGLLVSVHGTMLASLGMETSLLVALMLTCAWLSYARRPYLASVVASALILTRQDSILWVILLGLEIWRNRGRFPGREGMLIVVLTAPWYLFAFWHYGSIIPNSALAKIGQNQLMAVASELSFTQTLLDLLAGTNALSLMALSLLLVLLGVYSVVRYSRTLWWLPLWLITYLGVYEVLDAANFTWYFVPAITVAYIIIAVGLDQVLFRGLRHTSQRGRTRPRWRLGLAVLGGIALVAVWLGQWGLAHSAYQVRVDSLTEGKRWDYHRTGTWLAANTDDTAKIAAVEIGIIGYLSQRPILDSMGLVSPEMRTHLSGWSDTLVYALTSFWPQYTIVLDNSAWEGILPLWWFSDSYAPVAQFGNATVYARTDTRELGYTVDTDITYASGLHLAEVAFAEQLVEAGGDLDIWLHLGTGQEPLNDYQFTLQLVDSATADRIAPVNLWPYAEYSLYPASHWVPDDVLDVPFRYPVPHNLAPGTYRLGLLVYDDLQSDHVPALPAGATETVDEVFLGWLRMGDPPPPEPLAKNSTWQPVWAEWDGGIVLEQLAIPAEDPAAGETVPVDFVWRAAQPSDRDLITFVHLLNHHGEIVAQQDRRPYDGRFPTPSWRPGERLVERYVLTLPAELPEGSYSLRVGLYDGAGRLPLIQPQRQDSLLMENVLRIGR